MHIHILGIAGTLMCNIARLACQLGHVVTGCDRKFYPPSNVVLEQLGVSVVDHFEATQLKEFQADLYIVGNVVCRGFPIIEEILNRSLPYTSGPQWLFENLLCEKNVLAVSGTHGKTTITALLAWILQQCGRRPGFLIGGVPQADACSSDVGDSSLFVIEADEYDTAFFDKRSKFVHYNPRTLLINNIEYDHADIFSDLDAMLNQYHALMRVLPAAGKIIYASDCAAITRLFEQGCWTTHRLSFGQSPASDWLWRRDDSAVLFSPRESSVTYTLPAVVGAHNCHNSLAAFLMAQQVGVDPDQAMAAISSFPGVKRRLECFSQKGGVRFFDDFAHHPTAIKSTIAALRELSPDGRLFVVFEPSSNSFKKGVWADRLADSLCQADFVFCCRSGVSWAIDQALSPLGARSFIFDDVDLLLESIFSQVSSGDCVLIMSNGSFGGIYQKIRESR